MTGAFALLGLAASVAASVVTEWLSPVMIGMSILLQARTFYVIYVRKISTPATVVIAWIGLVFMIGFWVWYLALGGGAWMRECFKSGGM